jgi:hypothetical protein
LFLCLLSAVCCLRYASFSARSSYPVLPPAFTFHQHIAAYFILRPHLPPLHRPKPSIARKPKVIQPWSASHKLKEFDPLRTQRY